MSLYPFIAEKAEKDAVYQFLKKNGIDITYDFHARLNYDEVWNEIRHSNGKIIFQVDQGITVDEFKQIIEALLIEDEEEQKKKLYSIGEQVILISCPDENLPLLKEFAEQHKEILKRDEQISTTDKGTGGQ